MVHNLTEILLLCAITLFGAVQCQVNVCASHVNVYYLSEDECNYLCPVQSVINSHLLCKPDGLTLLPCNEANQQHYIDCIELKCEVILRAPCALKGTRFRAVQFIGTYDSNATVVTIHVTPETKPSKRPNHGDLPKITFDEPASQTYMYGILSFFFGVIAFFIFAVGFRFLYKRYQRHPIHVHTFSGHQLPLGTLQLRSFLSPSPFPPQLPLAHNEQAGIPGLDLPPSYVVASELLDPPPSYEDVSKPKTPSAQAKVTSL